MKNSSIVMILCVVCSLGLLADTQKLPDIMSLEELPLKLVGDFTGDEDIASPALPVIAEDGIIFFYDHKLKQIYKTHLENRELIPISLAGEGPKEYGAGVSDMFIDKESLYVIDWKGKLLCFGNDGTFKWEVPLRKRFNKIIGKTGDTLYLRIIDLPNRTTMNSELYKWTGGEEYRLIKKEPVSFASIHSMVNGKLVKGGGYMFISTPVFTINGDWLLSSASHDYKLNLLNLRSKETKTIVADAPGPELNPRLKRNKSIKSKQVYSMMNVFVDGPFIFIISNYFKDNKPRVDVFTFDGKLSGSFLVPFEMKTFQYRVNIMNHFVLYADNDETGFKVYKPALEGIGDPK